MTASRRLRSFILTSGKVKMVVVAISERAAVEKFFKQLRKDGGINYVTPLCEISSEGQPPMYFDMSKDEAHEITFMRSFEVRSGNIRNTTIAASEMDAAAYVLAKAIYENLKNLKAFKLGKTIQISSEGGATTWLLTKTGEQIDPPALRGRRQDLTHE